MYDACDKTAVAQERGGYIMAIDGGFPWQPADTQLQLICDGVLIDRYDLAAEDIRAIQQDLDGAKLP